MIRNLIVLPDGSELFSGASGAAILDCTLTRTVNSAEELTLGSVCSAMLEFTVIHPAAVTLTAGQEVTLYHVDSDGNRRQAGVFVLEKPVRTGAEKCRITAYDRVSRLDKDLTGWLKNRTNSCSLKEFARQVCAACDLTLADGQIPNGDLTIPVFSAGEVTGRQLMKWIGEAAGSFCRATPTGGVELAWYTPSGVVLGPGASQAAEVWEEKGNVSVSSPSVKAVDDNRGAVALTSPALSMTPEGEDGAVLASLKQPLQIPWFQGSLELADYRVAPVAAVQLQLSEGVLWPEAAEGTNAYILSGNPILSRGDERVRAALQTVLARLSTVGGYTPCKVSIPAAGDIQPGSLVTLTDTLGNSHTLPVMSVARSGQKDTLECTGEARRDSSAVRNNRTMEQIVQQKVNALGQQDIFDRLTDGGKLQGFYVQDGKLYINAEFVKIINLIAERICSIANGKTVRVDEGQIRFTETVDGGEVYVGSIFSLNELLELYSPKTLRIGGDMGTTVGNIGASTGVYGQAVSLVGDKVNIGMAQTAMSMMGKTLSWKDNGDGTFTLMGT